ncbi:hypothetical protein FA95DRAFT_1565167 [Auriscalpium vulgare]|uniref:Uncharacterized protein n=1 Tax=Auriscalpium vulgare TaxID=40419 RepID=A0ACB8RC89_9AGAM|nr:hypothetical protein FA95DRAFT_1565167 [Auriscalpium vulgare]
MLSQARISLSNGQQQAVAEAQPHEAASGSAKIQVAKEPAKKTKTRVVKGKERPPGPSRGIRGRLSALPSMPLDVLLEIFGHLSLSDLVQLARVNKVFRQMLLSRRLAALLWKQAFISEPDVPPCPSDRSEPSWAHLMFGGSFCHICGAKPVRKVVWAFRLRACRKCLAKRVVKHWGAVLLYCQSKVELIELVPFVHGRYINSSEQTYRLKAYVETMDTELKAIYSKHNGEKSEAFDEEFASWKALKMIAFDEIMKHEELCRACELKWEAERYVNNEVSKSKRYHAAKDRLLELGYDEKDIRMIADHREISVAKPLTDKVWDRIYPILVLALEDAREYRLNRELLERREKREALVELMYRKYIYALPSKISPLLPLHAHSWETFPALIAAIEEDEEASTSVAQRVSLALATNVAPKILGGIRRKLVALNSIIPLHRKFGIPSELYTTLTLTTKDFYTGPAGGLGLATTFFVCRSGAAEPCEGVFSGFDMLAHDCLNANDELPQVAAYSEDAAHAVAYVMQLVCRDPARTTALDLDRLDTPFICEDCSGNTHKYVMDWRGAVEHALMMRHDNMLRWEVMPGGLKCSDIFDSGVFDERWGSGRCPYHLAHAGEVINLVSWPTKSEIIAHLKSRCVGVLTLDSVCWF